MSEPAFRYQIHQVRKKRSILPLPTKPKPCPLHLMFPIIPLHLRHIRRALGTVSIMLILALHLHAIHIRHILIFVARMVSLRPVDKLVPIPALPSLKGVQTLSKLFRRQFEPGRVVGVAVDVLQEAVQAVLDVGIKVLFLRHAAVSCRGKSLDLDL